MSDHRLTWDVLGWFDQFVATGYDITAISETIRQDGGRRLLNAYNTTCRGNPRPPYLVDFTRANLSLVDGGVT